MKISFISIKKATICFMIFIFLKISKRLIQINISLIMPTNFRILCNFLVMDVSFSATCKSRLISALTNGFFERGGGWNFKNLQKSSSRKWSTMIPACHHKFSATSSGRQFFSGPMSGHQFCKMHHFYAVKIIICCRCAKICFPSSLHHL